ncbi:MAG: ABC transporter permease [Lachnospiraceae bacterium]|nr:ABC transporter permease [Lachnospiraceae bacterium]
MQLWKRATLYVHRKKRKSILLCLIIFVLSSLCVIGLLLRSVTDLAIAQTRESLSGAFRIAPDMQNRENVRLSEADGQTNVTYIGEPLNDEIADTIQRTQQISAYNAVMKENVLLQGNIRLIDYNGKYQDDPAAMRLISIEADTGSFYSADFQRGRLNLSDGEHITTGDEYMALISRNLAIQNDWKIGDKIQLSPCENHAGQEISVTIKGLFEVEEKQQNTDVAAPVHLLENRIFIDMISAGYLTDAADADYIDFFVDDPAQVVPIMEEIQKIEGINWNSFTIMASIEEYEKIANPLINITVLLNTLLTIIGALSIVVLALIQNFFHKAREHEVGIMLSIGISKTEIVLQHFSEMIIIALASFILSFAFCLFGWDNISMAVLKMTDINMNMKIDVVLAVKTIITTSVCGMIVLFLSVFFSNLWLMRLSPKKILSTLS